MLTPIKNKVLIERDPVKTEINGILLAEAAQKKEVFGTIVAIGPEVDEDLKVGQRILFGLHDGAHVPSEIVGHDGDFIIIRDEAVRGILESV